MGSMAAHRRRQTDGRGAQRSRLALAPIGGTAGVLQPHYACA